jgi:hypothetical protein
LLNKTFTTTREANMNIQPASLFDFNFFPSLPIRIETSAAPPPSDAGLPPLRPFDEHHRPDPPFAQALDDPRDHEAGRPSPFPPRTTMNRP